MQTWSELVGYHAARRPDAPFVSDPAGSATYAQLRRRLALRATWLAERGAGRGDRVAVLGRNSVALVEVLLACQHLGAIAVPLNHRLAPHELSYLVRHSGSLLIAADPEFSDLAQSAAAEHAVPVATFRGVEDLDGLAELPAAGADGNDICRIVYTSGTTSRPKGVTLTNRNIYVKSVSQAREFGLGYTDRGLIVGPLFHIAAFDVTLTTATYVGGSVHILPKFDAGQTLSLILTGRVSHVWLAPVMIRWVLDVAEELAVVSAQGPRLIIGGGEPTPPDLNERIATVFPSSWYANVYGLTETSTGDTILPAAQSRVRPGSVGLPVAEAEVQIVDPQGRPCPPGVTGQVAIGGEKLSPGYWDDPAATAASREGPLFLTGDAGYLDIEGFLFLVGRFKDMIISGGENIAALRAGELALQSPEAPAFPHRQAGGVQQVSGGQRRADGHPPVDAHHLAVAGRRDWIGNGREGDMPPARAVHGHPVGLRAFRHGAGPAEPHPPGLGHPDLAGLTGHAPHIPLPPAPPGDPESLIPPGLAPRRPPGRVARVEERGHRPGEVTQRLLLHRLGAFAQPQVLGPGLGELSALLQIARRARPAWVPVGVLLDSQVPHVSGMAAMVPQHRFLGGRGDEPVPGHTNIIASTTDISGEVKRRFLPGLKAGVSTPRFL